MKSTSTEFKPDTTQSIPSEEQAKIDQGLAEQRRITQQQT